MYQAKANSLKIYLQLRQTNKVRPPVLRAHAAKKLSAENTEKMDAKALQKQARGGNASESHLCKEF
jgi:hypothetical protein